MTDWTGGRRPLKDPEAEAARKQAYWDWLDRGDRRLKGMAEFVAYGVNAPLWWRRLETPEQADYEADFMHHSIGHSWDHYSQIGEVYSLRGRDETPKATILVKDGVVIHAREHRNARLAPEHMRALEDLAEMKGWAIEPDKLVFDHFENPGTRNTEIRILARQPSGAKVFTTTILSGSLSAGEAEALSNSLEMTERPTFEAGRLSADLADLGEVEIVSLKGVNDDAWSKLAATEIRARVKADPDADGMEP